MTKDKYILAVDLGTSGPRVALTTLYGEVIQSIKNEVKTFYFPPGGAEQNPKDWWNAFKYATQSLLQNTKVNIDDILCISIGSQWSTTVSVDKYGNPLMNALTWQDSRGAIYTRKLINSKINIEGYNPIKLYKWLKITGGAPGKSGTDSLSHVLYIKNKFPNIYKDTYKFLEPKDYINFRLTGKFTTTTDTIVLYWATDNRNISNIKYSSKMLKLSGLDKDKLPDLILSTDIIGNILPKIADELGLSKSTKIIGGGGDTSIAAIGAGAIENYKPLICIGTSSWLQCHVPYKKINIFMNMGSFPSAIPNKYLILNENKIAGECFRKLKDNILNLEKDAKENFYDDLTNMAELSPAGSNKLIFTPWLAGERTPFENDTLRGGFFNLSINTTRNDLIRSIYEGVSYNLKILLNCVEKFTNKRMDNINTIGAGSSSNFWCQVLSDVLDRNICQLNDPENAGPRGSSFLGSVALKKIKFDEINKHIKIKNTFKPRKNNRKIYDELFKEFLNIYKKNKAIYKRLNR